MRVAVLFSGGKDSSLAVHMLSHLYDVEAITVGFGVVDAWVQARRAASVLGVEHRVLELPRSIVEEAAKMCIADGHPSRAIQHIHVHSIEALAGEGVSHIADGTRRDDRVPKLTVSEAKSLEGRLKIKYMCPLWGFGSSTIRELAGRLFEFEQNVSSVGFNADYEVELRTLIERMAGSSQVERIFPSHHIQSHITGMRGGR
ncbi:MAG: DUF7411 family protein [Methermicoccaceae archaeon]